MFTQDEKLAAVGLVRDGMSYREAESASGISRSAIWKWDHELDEEAIGHYAGFLSERNQNEVPMDIESLPDDPEELKRIIFDQQFEIDITKAVIELVKKGPSVDPRTLPNREKAILVDAMAKRDTRYSISYLTSSLGLAPATFYYHRMRMGIDRDAGLRSSVISACATHPGFGYRRIKRLIDEGAASSRPVSEKRVRRIMYQESIQPPRRRKHSRYSSYDARKDKGAALPNVPLREDGTHDFSADAPNRLWVSDVTEFMLPSGKRVFLSPVLDCFDSYLPGWAISTSEKADDLTNPSLEQAAQKLSEEDRCCIHTDRGGQYFSKGWIEIANRFEIKRSMSRKGHSPDNARMEGFFGRLKMEFFDTIDWTDVGVGEFIERLDAWLAYYNEDREKLSLDWLSPMQYRKRFYEAA